MGENNKNKERPLQMLNAQTMLRKLESDIAKILAECTLNDQITTEDYRKNLEDHILGVMPRIHDNFDINLFDIVIVPVPDRPSTMAIQPQNFITALWLNGVSVTIEDLENTNRFVTKMAIYDWDEDKKLLGITPRSMPNFDEPIII